MVNKISFLLIFIFSLTTSLFAEEVKIFAEIEQREAYENEPLKGTITVTHELNQIIDNSSFILGKTKIPVELVKEVKMAPDQPLVLSIYSFKIPGRPQGLYALPAVSVKVGGTVYQSPMSSYTIQSKKRVDTTLQPVRNPVDESPQTLSPQMTAPTTPVKPALRLESGVEGNHSLYPGQRTTLVYRYYYSGDISLTTEKLPLLNAQGFIRIGEKEIKNFSQESVSVREISQQIEAIKPGTYSFGPSLIEGRAYKEDMLGNRVFTSDKLSSEAPPVEILVMPFPELNQPASFNGAVGKFTFTTALVSPNEMALGDEISLSLEITGKGNLKNITSPDLCCQPGFSGFFRFSDLPPAEEVEWETKKIIVKFRPLTALIKGIPSIEFSYFDPETAQYTILNSQPIPLSVKPSSPLMSEIAEEIFSKETAPLDQLDFQVVPTPSEIETIYPLTTSDLYNKIFGCWWVLALIPLGMFFLFYQNHLKNYLEWQRSQKPLMTSQELFEKSFTGEKCYFNRLKKAFKLALVEKGITASEDLPNEQLPNEGLSGEVKKLWAILDEKRFAGKGTYDVREIYRLSKELMDKIYTDSNSKKE